MVSSGSCSSKHGPQSKLTIGPSPELTERKKFVRVTFRNRLGESIQYGQVTIRPKRLGSQEAEFVCSSEGLSFEIDVVFPPQILLPSYTKGKDMPEVTISFRIARTIWLSQVRVFRFGRDENRDVRVGVLPEREEMLVRRSCSDVVALH